MAPLHTGRAAARQLFQRLDVAISTERSLKSDVAEVKRNVRRDPTKPATRPFLAATGKFAAANDTPREFLERCLEELEGAEPQIERFR